MTVDPEPSEFDRTQEEDHDLLTFGEAGLRLSETLDELRETLAARELEGDTTAAGRLRDRIAELQAAAERHRNQNINDANFEKFFGYPGTATRNTIG